MTLQIKKRRIQNLNTPFFGIILVIFILQHN